MGWNKHHEWNLCKYFCCRRCCYCCHCNVMVASLQSLPEAKVIEFCSASLSSHPQIRLWYMYKGHLSYPLSHLQTLSLLLINPVPLCVDRELGGRPRLQKDIGSHRRPRGRQAKHPSSSSFFCLPLKTMTITFFALLACLLASFFFICSSPKFGGASSMAEEKLKPEAAKFFMRLFGSHFS